MFGNKENHKNRNVVFIENSGSIRTNLEMRPSGRNEGHAMVVMDKYSTPALFDGGGQFVDSNDQMGGNRVAIDNASEGLTNDDVIVEGFGEEQRYPTKERGLLGEW